ncbi:unnamed protein product, partial [Meganyctiphanes norvegica]
LRKNRGKKINLSDINISDDEDLYDDVTDPDSASEFRDPHSVELMDEPTSISKLVNTANLQSSKLQKTHGKKINLLSNINDDKDLYDDDVEEPDFASEFHDPHSPKIIDEPTISSKLVPHANVQSSKLQKTRGKKIDLLSIINICGDEDLYDDDVADPDFVPVSQDPHSPELMDEPTTNSNLVRTAKFQCISVCTMAPKKQKENKLCRKKINFETKQKIIERKDSGARLAKISEEFDLPKSTVCTIYSKEGREAIQKAKKEFFLDDKDLYDDDAADSYFASVSRDPYSPEVMDEPTINSKLVGIANVQSKCQCVSDLAMAPKKQKENKSCR